MGAGTRGRTPCTWVQPGEEQGQGRAGLDSPWLLSQLRGEDEAVVLEGVWALAELCRVLSSLPGFLSSSSSSHHSHEFYLLSPHLESLERPAEPCVFPQCVIPSHRGRAPHHPQPSEPAAESCAPPRLSHAWTPSPACPDPPTWGKGQCSLSSGRTDPEVLGALPVCCSAGAELAADTAVPWDRGEGDQGDCSAARAGPPGWSPELCRAEPVLSRANAGPCRAAGVKWVAAGSRAKGARG